MDRSLVGRRLVLAGSLASLLVAGSAGAALAHDHYAAPAHQGAGQVLANSGNHPKFIANGDGTYSSCVSYGPVPNDTISKAWYGLETAHHGPDSGTHGRGDGCYTADGNPVTSDDRNPAIR